MKQLIQQIIPTLRFSFPYSVDDYAEHLYMENYHCHKDFSNVSTPDCAESIENYAEQTLKYQGKCLFSGEHGNQGNQFKVYKCAEEYHLKYRHSCEAYWVKDRKQNDRTNCHIILVAKNEQGRKDINFALSMANIDGYYYKPRIDLELLLSIPPENIIVTSACIAGWNYEDSDDIWLKIANHFKNNFFLEVQYHNTESQKKLNKHILNLATTYNLQIICGLDSHYVKEENSVKRDTILAYKKIHYDNEKGWYLDYPDTKTVIQRFQEQGVLNDTQILISIMNTNIFVNECDDIVFDRQFKIPNIYKGKSYDERVQLFKHKLNVAYSKEKYKSIEKKKGIVYEANEIIDSNVVDYFLLNEQIVQLAQNKYSGVLTTTSRGSASSFIVNKLLGLTTIDRFTSEIPIYPERFLTKERVIGGSMPDIDFNVATQEPFVQATRDLIGKYSCYPLMAVEVLKEKAAWQLYAGTNNISPSVANQISKYIDNYNKDLLYAEDDDKKDIHIEDYIPKEYIEIYNKSKEYQKITINLKVHACGHLLLDGDIRKEIGLISAISQTTGKRTLCTCIEGGYLDEFGYVKNDYLIVDSVGLTAKFFKSIGQPVPCFDELRKLVVNDKPTWDIYAKGITCCVNQVEKESTTKKCIKYQPTNLEELSAFIAGIRPGFKSLLPKFINREYYSTGEPVIDDLLQDSYHYLLYQESIMKVLSFLGISMGDTYKIIKSISKKKLKGQKLQDLKDTLRNNWKDKIGNLDNFDNVWNVIEDSSRYAFNAPHALSMGGDSLYQAWFKAHYTEKFYEVAINHYQEKNKKDKISALTQEIIKFYGYSLGTYRFGDDNRKVKVDSQAKTIYPNLSSVKGFGEQVATILYQLGQKGYSSFYEVLNVLFSEQGINKTIILSLIQIDYFRDYGDIAYLLQYYKIYSELNGVKQISKEKILDLGYSVSVFARFGKETEKQVRQLQSAQLIQYLIANTSVGLISLKERLSYQYDVLGVVSFVDNSLKKNKYFVLEIEEKKMLSNILLYEIATGKERKVKVWNSYFNKHQNRFNEKDIITIFSIKKENKKEPTGEVNDKGKIIYRNIQGEFEFWLQQYEVT